jgi:hypothetical protein
MTYSSPWLAPLMFGALGLWWTLAPNAAIKFYRALGAGYIGRWLGPKGLRVLGVFPLGLSIILEALLVWNRLK